MARSPMAVACAVLGPEGPFVESVEAVSRTGICLWRYLFAMKRRRQLTATMLLETRPRFVFAHAIRSLFREASATSRPSEVSYSLAFPRFGHRQFACCDPSSFPVSHL